MVLTIINSTEYDLIHPPEVITSHLPAEKQWVFMNLTQLKRWSILPNSLGPVEPHTSQEYEVKITAEEKARQERVSKRPPLDEILNLHDFEVILRL